ncbi:hypothetical protein MIZ03_2649 [Rhodoferax lithotrophicus]|uniref:Choice-of-anchor A family protein n=1 Tax=Rhodoferax lithotrophicus TaxID=2798804 RepID=A0ABN6D6U1_9BURK|nr:choice-of-anchor A family protein [Rhodoferax sp. MIZ03]BCO27760.1 hypothetical protein MIZ03_2649 [Rhodoferax sp. MIZ03]
MSNSTTVHKTFKRATLGALLLLSLCASPLALAYDPANPLGLSNGLNLLSFGSFTAPSSDVEGRVAIGGDASFSGYSINTKGFGALYSGTGLVVGGNLSFSSGAIYGNTIVGGNLSIGSGSSFENLIVGGNLSANNNWISATSITYAGTTSGLNPYQNPAAVQVTPGSIQTGIDFAAERARTTNLTQTFDALSNTGRAVNDWGTLALNANGASLAVFDLNSSDINGNMRLDNLAANTTVVINVHGQSVNFGAHGYDNFANGRVLFNLPEATQITFSGGINASFLAPLASFNSSHGVINGQVIVANWSGPTQVNDVAFNGSIAAVPEPETYAMMLAGLAAVGWAAKRRRSQKHTV